MSHVYLHTSLRSMVEFWLTYISFSRLKNMIISGGENVYPAEVENALGSLAGVAMACVIGTPSEKYGEAVCAVLVLKPGNYVFLFCFLVLVLFYKFYRSSSIYTVMTPILTCHSSITF